eukprot:15993949-Heterocapsa_arctica.AAC.1
MDDKPKLRKPLSKLGAVRIPRNKAKAMADGTQAPNNYSIIMMKINTTKATPSTPTSSTRTWATSHMPDG